MIYCNIYIYIYNTVYIHISTYIYVPRSPMMPSLQVTPISPRPSVATRTSWCTACWQRPWASPRCRSSSSPRPRPEPVEPVEPERKPWENLEKPGKKHGKTWKNLEKPGKTPVLPGKKWKTLEKHEFYHG